MFFHHRNFKQGSSLFSRDSEVSLKAYETIKLEEYYRFDTEEVDEVDLAQSSFLIKEETNENDTDS